MSEEKVNSNGTYTMMVPAAFLGKRTIRAGIYGTFRFSRDAAHALEERTYQERQYGPVDDELAQSINTPEGCAQFSRDIHDDPAFELTKVGPWDYAVESRLQVLSPDDLAALVDEVDLDAVEDEEELLLAGNLYAGASNSKHETRTIRLDRL